HSTASSIVFTSYRAYEATTSLDSAKGPSVTVVLPSRVVMRLPKREGSRPSVEISTPALFTSSMKGPRRLRSSGLGGSPRSLAASARRSPNIRISVVLPSCFRGPSPPDPRPAQAASTKTSNGRRPDRHARRRISKLLEDTGSGVTGSLVVDAGGAAGAV